MLQFMVNKVFVQWEVCCIHVHQQLAHSANACWTLNTPNLTITLPGSRFGKHQIAMLRHSNIFSPQLYKYFCILCSRQAKLWSFFNKTGKTAAQEFKPADNNRPQFKSIIFFLQIFHILLNACIIMGLGQLCISTVCASSHRVAWWMCDALIY